MSLYYELDPATRVWGDNLNIYIEQYDINGNSLGKVALSIARFQEIYFAQERLIAEAQGLPCED